jgi:hypothetical protein
VDGGKFSKVLADGSEFSVVSADGGEFSGGWIGKCKQST